MKSDILSWTGDYDKGLFTSSGGSREYTVIKIGEPGLVKYPWVLTPSTHIDKENSSKNEFVRFTSALRAMDAAEMWERDPAMFLATLEASRR